jgi:hypothetical protein
MKVRFQNNFIVPGFGRKRFRQGICMDVPEALRTHLPSTAEILPDEYEEDNAWQAHEDKAMTKYAEEQAAAERTRQTMNASGMDGWADETDPTVGPQPISEPEGFVEEWEFKGQIYKTEAAMKAAITRAEKKESE